MPALAQATADGSDSKLLKTLANFDWPIVDDRGLEPLTADSRNDLMEIVWITDMTIQPLPSSANYRPTNGTG
ncbi:MAG: hypothetical protein ACRERV_04535 [Methylococcales bacterium]